jgi:hypothetical protein
MDTIVEGYAITPQGWRKLGSAEGQDLIFRVGRGSNNE